MASVDVKVKMCTEEFDVFSRVECHNFGCPFINSDSASCQLKIVVIGEGGECKHMSLLDDK